MQFRPLCEYDVAALEADLRAGGFTPSHATAILRAFYRGHGHFQADPARLGKALAASLGAGGPPRPSEVRLRTVSGDGTTKLLVGFTAGGAVESVLMPSHRDGRAMACVSSQVGCAMGCDFCASTRGGLERNLTSGEIVEQFLHLSTQAAALGRRITTLVFMGMGEPLSNYEQVIAAIRRIADPTLGGLGWRHVTLSTVGLVPGIDRLAAENLNIHLAVSLHAPDDATRARIVPINRRYPVADVMAAARRFFERTGRIVTLEYCLLMGINDSDDHAHALVDLLAGFRAHINLIPYNSIGAGLSGAVYQRPSLTRMSAFLAILRHAGVTAHFRHTRGDDVHAACGQLREKSASPTPLRLPLPAAW